AIGSNCLNPSIVTEHTNIPEPSSSQSSLSSQSFLSLQSFSSLRSFSLPTENPKDEEEEQSRSLSTKRKNTFSRLLINKESLNQLKEAEKETKKLASEKQYKKDEALQKKTA
ncbi:14847_t:CDS:2, partial [Dentiscutata erythropus]